MKVRKFKHRMLNKTKRVLFHKLRAQFRRYVLKLMKNSTFGKLGPKPYDFETKRAELREEYNSGFDSVAEE